VAYVFTRLRDAAARTTVEDLRPNVAGGESRVGPPCRL